MKQFIIMAGIFGLIACDTSTDPKDAGTIWDNVPAGKSLATLDIQGTAPAIAAKAFADSVTISVKDTAGFALGSLTLRDARVALKDIELKSKEELEGENEIEIEIEFEGPFVVDMIANTVIPTLDTVVIDTGNYTQIKLKIDKIDGDENDDDGAQLVAADDPLFGNSIYLEGTYTGTTAGGAVTGVPFALSFDFNENFELSTVDSSTGVADTSVGFNIQEQALAAVIIAFRLNKWLDFSDPETNDKGVDFGDLVTSQDSSGNLFILLDENSDGDNKEIRKVIKENIKESADYGEDKDGDGELGSDEDDDPDEDDEDDD